VYGHVTAGIDIFLDEGAKRKIIMIIATKKRNGLNVSVINGVAG
jgi:hypothetical protein